MTTSPKPAPPGDRLFALIASISGSGSVDWCDRVRALLDEVRAEAVAPATDPVCKSTEGCHRVVACDPGCAVTAARMYAKLAAAQSAATDQTTPSRRAGLRAEIANALEAADYRMDMRRGDLADAVLPVLYREWPWLRAEAEGAVLPAPVDRTAVLAEAEHAIRQATGNCSYKAADGCDYCNGVDAALDQLCGLADEVEVPLSPYYSHEACGFHWHGRDGMDIPMRDGQPVCPRCELRTVGKQLHHFEKRCEELRAESKRRGRRVLEQSERIRALERQVDEVREQLGAEILRAGQAEAELRRMADEAQQPTSPAPLAAGLPLVKGNCPACQRASLFLGSGGYVTCSNSDCQEPDAASTVLEQYGSEAHPPEHTWAAELRDPLADEWVPGTRHTVRDRAVNALAHAKRIGPAWKDGSPTERRLVRATTTYTVEAQQPAEPPVHLGGRANAELCPACKLEAPRPWPFLCPAEPDAPAVVAPQPKEAGA